MAQALTPSGRSTRASGLVFMLAALAAFSPLSIDMYLPGLPLIVGEFGTTVAAGQTTLSLFLIGLAGGQLIYGPLSDRFGRRPLLFGGVAIYVAATAACALAGTIGELALWRLVQALGGCAGVVISRAVVADRFKGNEAASALSLLMIVMGAAPILAPVLGAAILDGAGWRGVFWFQAAFALTAGAVALFCLPESRSAEVAARARTESAVRAYGHLLGQRRFVGYAMTAGFGNACLLAYVSAAPDIFYGVFALKPSTVGWLFGLTGGLIIAVNQVNRVLLRRIESARILNGAVVWSVVMTAPLLIVGWTGVGGLAAWVGCVILAVVPFGLVQSNAAAAAFAAQPLRIGSAAALLGAGGYGAGAVSGWALSLLHDGSLRPTATVMSFCLLASAAMLIWVRRAERDLPIAEGASPPNVTTNNQPRGGREPE